MPSQASTALVTCFLPLYVAYQFVGTASDSFADYKRWADAAVTTAVFGALLATPLSSLAMHFLAPRLQEVMSSHFSRQRRQILHTLCRNLEH